MTLGISGKTGVYGVIGDPIEHTLSPAMQNAAFESSGRDCVFLAFKVVPSELRGAMQGLRSLGIRGLNVTMPYKNAVIPFLDEVDQTAKVLCSVNTILNDNGKLRGFSTDGAGAHRALEENGVRLTGKKLVLLGAGGAAKAIAYTLARELEELVILNRTPEKIDSLAQSINEEYHKKVSVSNLLPSNIQENLRNADILINATSVGMHPKDNLSLVDPEWLKPTLTVMDIIYSPLETKLARDAKAAGAKIINGVEMLVYQGAMSFEIWTGNPAPVDVMRKAALGQLGNRRKT
jgi:shikimate dehydrogenase